jgi:hypothetical protein
MMDAVVNNSRSIMDRSLKTALLVDGFWDRWLVHGLEKEDLLSIRSSLTTVEKWVKLWSDLAAEKARRAKELLEAGEEQQAEALFRKASLYYNLTQWIFPDPSEEKRKWYELCQIAIREADYLSSVETDYVQFKMGHESCFGRIRIPANPMGCIIMINPIDSTKEELYTYEMDFIKAGMMTISFDGPGQGETFIRKEFRGTQERLREFADQVITYTRNLTGLPIFLFGTSSGASWAVYGSSHPEVKKVVAVSPTDLRGKLFISSYFNGRLDSCLDEFELVPNYDKVIFRRPVLIYQGGKDAMVAAPFVDQLFNKMAEGRKKVLFEEEGHCCNYKLGQIRQESLRWYMEN